MGTVKCIDCDSEYPKSRHYFPWGSKKPKVCKPCIETRFYYMLKSLGIDEVKIEESVNGDK